MSVNLVSVLWTDRLSMICTNTEYLSVKALDTYKYLTGSGWTFYAVDQTRGRCRYNQKVITIPVWCMQKSKRYIEWYICHEMSHAIAGYKANHGIQFQKVLQSLCSNEAMQYELTYKAREVVRAGIVLSCLLDD